MQRQSLGSPLTKQQQLHEPHHLHTSSSVSTINNTSINNLLLYETEEKEEEDELKKLKIKNTTKPQNYIHIIPILTLLCFLILYLSSHQPSQKDMAQFNGFINAAAGEEDISELNDINVEIRNGDDTSSILLGVRSLKNLLRHDDEEIKHRMLHRKIAHF